MSQHFNNNLTSSDDGSHLPLSPFYRLDEELKDIVPHFKCCIVCGSSCQKSTISRCAGCHSVFYCSRDCQKRHWKLGMHKVTCKNAQGINKELDKVRGGQNQQERLLTRIRTLSQAEHPEEVVVGEVSKAEELLMSNRCILYKGLISTLYVPIATASVQNPPAVNQKAIYQSILQYLNISIEYLSFNQVLEDNNIALPFDSIPDSLLRLQRDQMAFDFIQWNTELMDNVYFEVERRKIDRSLPRMPRGCVTDKNYQCIPPYDACYPYRNGNRCSASDIASVMDSSKYGAGSRFDRSSSRTTNTFAHLLSLGYVPFFHALTLCMMKAKLWFHLQAMDEFYALLGCCKQALSNRDNDPSNGQSLLPLNKLAGNHDILYYIRDYVIDVKEFLPMSRFEVQDKKKIQKQILNLLQAMKHREEETANLILLSNVDDYVNTPLQFGSTALLHYPNVKLQLQQWYMHT